MAITYRNGSVATGAAATLDIAKPASVVSGDVLWAFVTGQAGGASITAPTGWVQRGTGNAPTSATPATAFTRVVDGGVNDPANYTFSESGSTFMEGLIDAYIGVDNTTPMDATATVATGTAATITWPNITTATDNAWHLASALDTITLPSTPTGYASRSSTAAAAHNSDKAITPAGLVTGVTVGSGSDWAAISGALRPAGASSFNFAVMTAMVKHGNDPLVLPPQVVASGMTPPEQMPT